ncbi:TetR/AcrR family transcriptional regulator [Kibdelosporangium philippinense]|uniref:TetR/AcrR family transcriptional regulator n=1 Tax=Kibdelosporangium philippinense TaxID=211113 RepID=A0ABS8Z9G1_9PSEU|nr:TetR/AcrR family transcriptional regulator [Kibdelosporangium philippinense]MCE7003673.1 TetR/AcrR family transcriptional regulator [Kibdelosporangium philippinense]
MAESPVRRPGGRSAHVRTSVLDAGLAELVDVGFHALSLEGIAKRAGVNKTTLYRRWESKEALMLDAIRERAAARVPIPDTGSLRDDLLTLVRTAIANLLTPEVQAMVRVGIALAPHEAAVATMVDSFWTDRLAVDGVIVERAIRRGEIPPVDPAELIEAVLGPPYFRALVAGRPVTDDFLVRTVDLVLNGVGADDTARC